MSNTVWLNRLGMTLDFASFWLVAPEIVGEVRLRRWEHALEQALKLSPRVFGLVYMIGVITTAILVAATIGVHLYGNLQRALGSWAYLGSVFLGVGLLGVLNEWVGFATLRSIQARMIKPALQRLADDTLIRHRSLAAGALAYVAGFLIQMICTFL